MRIIAIVGARPQFIKSAMLNIAVREKQLAGADIQLDLLHTGQHYDHQMSEVFFRNMNIPEPKWRLSRSGTAEEMADGITWILEREKPDYVLVFGNANTTYADWNAAQSSYNTLRTVSYIAWGGAAVLYVFNLYRAYAMQPRRATGLAFTPTLMPTEAGFAPGVSLSINF